jgi:hypothetical protein
MAWTGSAIFQQAMLNPIAGRCWTTAAPTTYGSLSADVINVALFGTLTPDKTAAVASTGYNTGVWTTGNETAGGVNWPAGGLPLASKAFAIDTASSSVCFGAANLAGAGNVTIAAAFGCLVYDNTITGGTVAKQGLCFNYFGGSQSVTAGTFTIIWPTVGATTGVFNITV